MKKKIRALTPKQFIIVHRLLYKQFDSEYTKDVVQIIKSK